MRLCFKKVQLYCTVENKNLWVMRDMKTPQFSWIQRAQPRTELCTTIFKRENVANLSRLKAAWIIGCHMAHIQSRSSRSGSNFLVVRGSFVQDAGWNQSRSIISIQVGLGCDWNSLCDTVIRHSEIQHFLGGCSPQIFVPHCAYIAWLCFIWDRYFKYTGQACMCLCHLPWWFIGFVVPKLSMVPRVWFLTSVSIFRWKWNT